MSAKGYIRGAKGVLLFAVLWCYCPIIEANVGGWERQEVDWQITGGGRVKAINYPQEGHKQLFSKEGNRKSKVFHKEIRQGSKISRRSSLLQLQQSAVPIVVNVIDSPAVDGFVPWIAVEVTDARSDSDVFDAVTQYSVTGNYLTASPQSDYVIGIFDTGASAHVMGNSAAGRAGLLDSVPELITSNLITISGVTGSTEALVSQPIGIFIDGLGAVEPNGFFLDRSGMKGQSNVAIAVGQGGSPVDLPTAIGAPMSVYFTASFHNDTSVTVTWDGNNYTAPDIRIYKQDDPFIPTYANTIPLELRPLGASSVQYIPGLTEDFDFEPTSPSVLIGNSSQSIFFVASVDLYNNTKSAIDKTRFMFDTGAQITVIGSRVGARLKLNPASPDFEVEIQGVTGDVIMAPGFYIDAIDIPALGEWLSFTNIPVVLLDVPSPEGGTVDGIIGMNLFNDLNFVLRGGGLFLQDDPSVEFKIIVVGDIAPAGGDEKVDYLDLAELAAHWLETSSSQGWNPLCDLAPWGNPDGVVNFLDFAVMAEHWFEGVGP